MYVFVLAAAAMTLYFVAAAWRRPRLAELLAVVLWGSYAVYEYLVANGTLCDPYCNIRVDLALFLPLLGSATYLALQKEPRTGAAAALAVICLALVAWMASVFGNAAVAVGAGAGALVVAVYGIASYRARRRAPSPGDLDGRAAAGPRADGGG